MLDFQVFFGGMPEIPDMFWGSLSHQTVILCVWGGGCRADARAQPMYQSTPSGIRTHHNVIAFVLDLMTEFIVNPQVIPHRCWCPKKARDEQFSTEHSEYCRIAVGSVHYESRLDSSFLCFIERYGRAPNKNQ